MSDLFDHISARQKRVSMPIAVTAALVPMALTLMFSASAMAETDLVATVGAAGSSPAQSAPSPAPAEPAETPEPVESEEAAAPEEARSPASDEPDPSADPKPAVTDGLVSDTPTEVARRVLTAAAADEPSDNQVTNRVTQAVETIHDETAPLRHSTETVTRSLDQTVSATRDRINALAHQPLQVASDALPNVTGAQPAEETLRSLLLPEGRRETDAGSLPPSAALGLPGNPPPAVDPPQSASVLGGLFPQPLGKAAGFELLHAEASRSATDSNASAAAPSPVDAVLSSTGSAGESSDGLAPPDGDNPPLPPPDLPFAAVAGSGGSSFVPIVGLLALLALVAPAILRRLREVLDLSAPTLFVCALERPG